MGSSTKLATTNTTEVGTAMLPLRRVTSAGTALSRAGSAACYAAAAFLAAFAVLLTLPLQAQAQTAITLVSNTGQGADNDAGGTRDRAQVFTTGSNSDGYTLSSVNIISEDLEGDDATVSVCTVDGSGYPTTTCTPLTAPTGFAAGTLTFTASPSMTLARNTTYSVLIGTPGGETLLLDSTTSDDDTGGGAGWSLDNSYDFKNASNVWGTISNGQSFRITIKGTLGTTTTNTLATGAPTNTGTAQVGQTLTAVTTGIMDANGLTSPGYTYQWIRVNGSDANISGANSSTYTLLDADLGKTIKVQVTFTDDASNTETLTSDAPATVVAAATTPTMVLSPTSLDVPEASAAGYSVKLGTLPTAEVTVSIGGTSGTDLSLNMASLTFTTSNWNTAQMVTVWAAGDSDATHDSATLTHTATGGGYGAVSADLPVTVTDITRMRLVPVVETVPEGESRSIRARLPMPLDDDVSIIVTVTPNGGRDDEYELSADTVLTIAAGTTESTGNVVFTSLDDFTDTGVRYFDATLTPDHARVDADTETFAVVDDDNTSSLLQVTPPKIFENGGTATLRGAKLSLHEGVVKMEVSLEPSGRATLSSNTLTFPPGALYATETLTITAVDNTSVEADQVITISATVTEGRGIRTPAPVRLTIEDDEGMSLEVALVLTPPRVREGLASTVTAVASAPLSAEATIMVSASPAHSDTRMDDYVLSADPVLTIPSGGTRSTGTVTIATADDQFSGGSRRRWVTVSGTVTGGGGVENPENQQLVVLEDDQSIPVAVIATPATIAEGGVSTITLRSLGQPLPAGVMVTIRESSDEVELSADPVLMIAEGETESTGTVTLTAVQDTNMQNGAVTVRGVPDNAFVRVAPAYVSTVDDDATAAFLTVSPVPSRFYEGQTSTIIAALSQTLSDTVTVTIRVDEADVNHSATAGDYTLSGNLTLTIPPGEMRGTGPTLTASNDEYFGPLTQRTVVLDIASVTGIGRTNVVKHSDWYIFEDEEQPRVTLETTPASIPENSGQSTVTAKLNTKVAHDVEVTISAAAVGTTESDDFTQNGTQLTIPANAKASMGTVTITGVDDDVDGPDKNLVVAGTAKVVGMETSGLVWDPYEEGLTIRDDDTRGVTVSADTLPVNEGSTGTYTVVLNSQPTASVMVTPSSDNSDVTVSSALTFTTTNWNTAQTVTVTAAQDSDAVDDAATISHAVMGGDYGAVTAASVAVTVDDDEVPDTTAPTVTSIVRQTPASSPTNANSLTWRVTFSEAVSNVDAMDFAVSGTTATLTVAAVSGVTGAYDVTASGGNLAGLSATVTLSFATGQNIQDAANIALTNTAPTGTNDNTYVLDNTAPTVTITGVPGTSSAPFTATFTFSEAVTGFVVGDITLGNATASNFTDTSMTVYAALITPTANGTVTVDVAVNVAQDAVGNDNTAATQASSTYTVPVPVITIEAGTSPVTEGTSAAFTLSRTGSTTAALTVNATVSETGGDMVAPANEGARTVTFQANSATATVSVPTVADRVDEADGVVTATVTADTATPATYTVGTPSSATVTVSDDDTRGVTVSAETLPVNEGSTGTYTVVLNSQPTASVTVTPSSDNSDVTVSSALTFTTTNWNTAQTVTVTAAQDSDAVDDAATISHAVMGGDYGAVTAASVAVTVDDDETVDTTAPRVTSIVRQTPASSPTNANSLTWRVTFSEAVSNVDAMDFAVSGTTATLTVAAVSRVTGAYDVTASGGNLAGLSATVTLSFATGQNIQDAANIALTNTAPTGTNDNTYVLDNTAPTVTITGVPGTSSAPFTATFTFSEAVTGFVVGDITLGNATASNFTDTSMTVYAALITPTANGTVTVDVAVNVAQDAVGNDNTAATQASSTYRPLGPSVPGAPASLTATAGDGEVFLEWTAPADDGGSPVTGYEYRYAAGDGVPEDTPWQSAGQSLERTVAALTNGQQYAFEVRARNRAGPGAPAQAVATPRRARDRKVLRVPGAPEPLTATGGDGEVFLEWTAPADDGGSLVTDYEYRYAAGDGVPRNTPWRSAGRILERTVIWLTNGQQYVFEVRALNDVGPGAPAQAVATPLGVPGAPEPLTATGGDGEVFLEWTAPANDGGTPVTGYEYRHAAGAAVPEGTSWRSAGLDLERTVTGLANGQQYAFEVRARNRVGAGEARGATATPVGSPGAPASLAATAGDKEVALAWSAPADDGGTPVTGYEYRYAAGDAVPARTPWQSAGLNLERTVTGLANGQQHAFEVRARNRVGEGEAREALATPLGAPGAPESLTATAADGEVVLAWSAPADDGGTPVTGYEYRYAAGDAVPARTPWQSAGLNLERTVTGLANGQQYAFEVRARNRVGEGEARGATATPVGSPGAPASLAATAGDKEVALAWSAPADDGGTPVTGYEYRYAAGDAVPARTPWQSAGLNLERTVTGLANGQQHAFEVRARNRVGEGEAREALATPLGAPGAPESLTATAADGEVVLAWSAPADDGGTPVTGYEYRYAAGDAVPARTPWQSAGLNLERTVTGLANGQQHAFEVRARNRVGEGEARGATATPVGSPGAPASLAATAGDKEVALAWSAPADDGGTPVTGYEYRYAAGDAVPARTPWQSAGLNLERTVTGLANGQQHAFEVRARNRVGEGEAREALATPLGAPGAPESLTATAADGEVVLAWSAPADDGGTPVTGYEYRYAAGDAVPARTPWQSAGLNLERTVTGLANGQQHAFEVRARNRVGPGEGSRTTALPLRLRAELFSLTAAAEGEALVVGVRRSGGLAFPAHAYIGVTDNAFPGVTAAEEGRDDGLGRHRLEFAAGAAEATVTVTVAFDGERRQDRVLTATLDSAELEVDGVKRAYELVTPALVVPVTEGDAGLSVADARVQGRSSVLAFTVSMDRTRDVAVRVDYATQDGSATAGEDYTAVTGTLTIAAGGREGTVEVPVLPALHVTGERTLTLRLSNAGNAVIDDGVATGTIVRESELPKAWLARFGRTASDHAAQAIARRVESGGRETHVTVAGRRLDRLVGGLRSGGGGLLASTARNMAGRATSRLAATAARGARPDGPGAESGGSAESLRSAVLPGLELRLPAVRDALLGSSFHVEGGAPQAGGGGKAWAAWGDVATTHFEADAGGLGINGDVTTGTLGVDRQWRKLLVGLALSRSGGEGAYGEGAGTITSTLTSVHPYARYRLAERAQLWGAMGWGRGGLRLTPGSGAGIETDLSNSMAALGGRAVLRRAGATGSSVEIALRSDLLWTSTSSDKADVLAEATGTARRGRLMLEGAGQFSGLGGVLRPKVEGGLRYDAGDAENGAGLEVGGGLDWARGGLALRVNGRMLLAYADASYEEWGYGGSLIYEPGADGRGLRMRLGFDAGATASGVQSLWALENAAGLVRQGGMPFARRSDAEVGFGLGGALLWYPYLAADATGQKRFGLRLNSGRSLNVGLEFGQRSDGTQPAKDALVLRGDIRF